MKTLTLILLSLLVTATLVSGQTKRPEVKVRVEATVMDYIEMITMADIDVGTVIPSEDILRLDSRNDQGAGSIKIHGRPNAAIQVNYSVQVEMVNVTTSTPLTVTYNVSGNQENNQSASSVFTNNPTTAILSADGDYYLWIGCAFSLINLVPGQYDGDFVIEVDYN